MRLLVLLIIATSLAAGCGEEPATPGASPTGGPVTGGAVAHDAADRGEPVTPGTSPTPDAVVPDPAVAAAGPLPGFTAGPSGADVASTGPDVPILRDVRIARHAGFDRMVFEFDSVGLPQWRVAYVDGPVAECGSGHRVALEGRGRLQVRFSGAHAHTKAGEATSGPRRRAVALPALRELVRTCDFEAEVTWVAGVAERAPYRPRVLADPSRLVIDVAH